MMMRTLTTLQRLRASLWVVPLGMIVVGAGLAVAALSVRLADGDGGAWWLYAGTAKEAPGFLETLFGSMITMGTLSISLTMVTLTLAAQQLGPRLIHHFMASRQTQISIGLFLATIVHLLLVLRAVHGHTGDAGLPNLAVTVGTALVLASVVALLLFTHHLACSIVSDSVIEGVGASLDAAAERLLPPEASADAIRAAERSCVPRDGRPIRLPRGGYIQAVDHEGLVACAHAQGCVIALSHRPGHHLLAHAIHGRVSPPSALTLALQHAFEEAILLGGERTPDQDLEFQIRQLVEIGLRALSPGLNDTDTAVAVIDRLALSLARIMRHGPAQGTWRDRDGAVRLVMPASTFAGMMDAAFDQIRQSSDKYPAILIRLVETFEQLASLASEAQRSIIAAHVTRVAVAGRQAIEDEHDLASFEARVRAAEWRLEPSRPE